VSILKGLPCAVACLAAVSVGAFARAARADDSPGDIVQRARATYAALGTYSDRGTVVHEYSPTEHDQHGFTTLFQRAPRRFLFDFHKQGGDRFVIWGEPEAFHTWWKTTAQISDYPNPDNVAAINLSDVPTAGSATKIPILLYPKAPLNGSLTHFADPVLDGTEDIDGQKCFRLVGHTNDVYGATGRETNFRKVTLWIDAHTFLIRRIREETKTTPGSVDRTTIAFEPSANPELSDSQFKFMPPERP
jgi:outer membrane lipoprotein-sorting protein